MALQIFSRLAFPSELFFVVSFIFPEKPKISIKQTKLGMGIFYAPSVVTEHFLC